MEEVAHQKMHSSQGEEHARVVAVEAMNGMPEYKQFCAQLAVDATWDAMGKLERRPGETSARRLIRDLAPRRLPFEASYTVGRNWAT